MPCKKIQQPPSICTPSSRRLLESLAIKDLPQSYCFCPNSNQDSGPGPSECGPCACDEDDCAPGTCCAMNRVCEPIAYPEQNQATETCLPSCKSFEVEAMLDEMKRSQEIIRKLALEAIEILHPEHDCPTCKQNAQAQIGPNEKEPYCEHCKDSNKFDATNQPRNKFFATPFTPLQSRVHTRTSSVPIAQTAFQIKDGRLAKTDNIEDSSFKKKSKADIDIEESLKQKSKADIDKEEGLKQKGKEDIDIEESLKKKEDIPPTNVYEPYREESKSCLKKIFGSKPSICSCDGERNLDVNCACKAKINSRCGSKSYFKRLFGKKPSVCSCNEDPMGQYEEDEGRFSKTCIKKIFKRKNDCYCPPKPPVLEGQKQSSSTDEDKKINGEIGIRKSSVDVGQVELRRSSLAASFVLPKCDKDICQCHYPPSYNQYFTCTGQVTGNCSCDKNV